MWPDYSKQLYENFDKHFWQKRWTVVGFREFPEGQSNSEWYFDVDSGPVIAGFGAAASAFGIGAARANGRFDHAYPLTAEAIVLSWPLPTGTLAGPKFLSNMTNAPYLGEAALLFSFTRTPGKETEITSGGKMPIFVYLILATYLGIGTVVVLADFLSLRRWKRWISKKPIPLEKIQLAIWIVLVAVGIVLYTTHNLAIGLLLILSAQFLPRSSKRIIRESNNKCA